MSDSLFKSIGGEAAVNAAVDLFYRKVLIDESISHFLKAPIWMHKEIDKKVF